jgi:5'-AMP-activated protein kinase catalytic alpha subunit
MEFCQGGELFDHIVKRTKLHEIEACMFYQQIIDGIEYIHKQKIVHRDLKPENLLLHERKKIKIVDFGLSNTYLNDDTLKTACGSPCYAAPEMIAGKRYKGLKVDIWSSGVVLFAMICGYLPFEDPQTSKLYKKILNCEMTIPKFVSNDGRDFLKKILNVDPEERVDIEAIRHHKWFNLVDFKRKQDGIIIGINSIPVSGLT